MDTINLKIPFTKKAWAKEQGCKWDPDGKTWYIPVDKNKACLQEYIKNPTIVERDIVKKRWEYELETNPYAKMLEDKEAIDKKYKKNIGKLLVKVLEKNYD